MRGTAAVTESRVNDGNDITDEMPQTLHKKRSWSRNEEIIHSERTTASLIHTETCLHLHGTTRRMKETSKEPGNKQ